MALKLVGCRWLIFLLRPTSYSLTTFMSPLLRHPHVVKAQRRKGFKQPKVHRKFCILLRSALNWVTIRIVKLKKLRARGRYWILIIELMLKLPMTIHLKMLRLIEWLQPKQRRLNSVWTKPRALASEYKKGRDLHSLNRQILHPKACTENALKRDCKMRCSLKVL